MTEQSSSHTCSPVGTAELCARISAQQFLLEVVIANQLNDMSDVEIPDIIARLRQTLGKFSKVATASSAIEAVTTSDMAMRTVEHGNHILDRALDRLRSGSAA